MTTVAYAFHDLVSINVELGDRQLPPYYSHYFRHFETAASAGLPGYEVREFSRFQLPAEHKNVSNAFLGFSQGVCLPAEAYALAFDHGRIIEYTNTPNRATNLWLQTCLLPQNVSLLHSAALTFNGQGFVFPAFGGAGKTMLIAALRQHPGFRFFGDDFVAVDINGDMYAYPSDFSVYPQHLEMFPELHGTIYHEYFLERERRPKLWDAWYRLPGNPLLQPIAMKLRKTVDPRRLGPLFPSLPGWELDYVKVPVTAVLEKEQIGSTAQVQHCMLLSRYAGDDLQVVEIDSSQLVGRLAGILNVEFRYGLIYLHLLASFGAFDLHQFEERQRRILQACFENMRIHEVLIPITMTPADYVARMQRLIMELAA